MNSGLRYIRQCGTLRLYIKSSTRGFAVYIYKACARADGTRVGIWQNNVECNNANNIIFDNVNV